MFNLVNFKKIFDKTREFLFVNDKEFKNSLSQYKMELDLITNESDFNSKSAEINNKVAKEIAIKGMVVSHQKLERFQSSLANILKCAICLEKLQFPLEVDE